MYRTALNKYIFFSSTKLYPMKKIKNSITAPNESMHIHEQHMSCKMSYNSINENNDSLTAPIQINGCQGIKSTI
jgi:hypothetical protein